MKTLDFALKYAELGWPVFPLHSISNGKCSCGSEKCASPGKHPRIKNWPDEASTDSDKIKRWWEMWTDSNIAVPTGFKSGLAVFDIDKKTGGLENLASLESKYGKFLGLLALTGGGGKHYFFKYPKTGFKTTANHIAPGIDTRGDGGYVVVAPSTHISGKKYVWSCEEPGKEELPEMPESILDLMKMKDSPKKTSEPTPSIDPSQMGEGSGRNDYLTSYGGKFRRVGLEHEEIEKSLLLENQKFLVPLPEDEVKKIAASLAKYPAGSGKTSTKSIEAVLEESAMRNLAENSSIDEKSTAVRKFIALANKLDDVARQLAVNEALKILKTAKITGFGDLLKKELLRNNPEESEGQGRPVTFPEIEPWPDEVDGADLLDEIEGVLKRYVVLPEYTETAIALWVLHTWALEAFDISPYLYLKSPEMRCGKTTTLSLLKYMVQREVSSSHMSPATIFRVVEVHNPTLLIDEADTFLKLSDELNGIINAGHSRSLAFVWRIEGDDHIPAKFNVFCPKVIAGIGSQRETLEDRSIIVPMKRKKINEKVPRLPRKLEDELKPIRQKCLRWVMDNIDALKDADPAVPDELNDRAADNWRPSLAIADRVGGEWPQKAKEAALSISGGKELGDSSIGVELLSDIQTYFIENNASEVDTQKLLEYLHGLEERPWQEWGNKGRPITPQHLAKNLEKFGIRPRQYKVSNEKKRGYVKNDFHDAFERYLPGTSGTSLKNMDVFNKLSGTNEQKVPGKNHCNSLYNNIVPEVPDRM